MRPFYHLLVFCCVLSSAYVGHAQTIHPVTKRPIAPVMGVAGADWLDREERIREERPDLAIAALDLKPGLAVADIGAGTGFYALRIAPLILPGGKVWANDLQPGMLAKITSNAHAQKVENMIVVQGTETDCKLPDSRIDIVLMVDVYHEFSHPQQMLRSVWRALSPNGRLVLLEFRKEDPDVPIRPEHKMSLSQVKAEIVPEGFSFEKSVETLPWQHMIFFRKVADDR